ncbi:NAD(P)-binding domain-containing protein [Desulfatirhabdium butyrativorans]|uniref:NAD(P)-binding domain-containing protein n=1 Tax=Desulfatirhabdium butyrativorans TaxID=340467 RepID=UPI000415CBC2|nr:NAD(P)-binding domain-containing protein [Desulfatirhabdium butyrativorans]
MSTRYDIVIIGAGPGGIAAGWLAKSFGMSYVLLEKGPMVLQGIRETYPKGKRVYPTVPKHHDEPFAIPDLKPPEERIPVEQYVERVEQAVLEQQLNIRYREEFKELSGNHPDYLVRTNRDTYLTRNVVLAFGSNIPNDLGIYGEARTIARTLENGEAYIGVNVLVIGGGNAAADVVASLSRIKREAKDPTDVYWAHVKENFEINKDTARDLGEEILLGGHIKILQRAVPKIGEVDADGIDRLYIHQTTTPSIPNELYMYQGISFPMKNVIACIGSHGPSAIFDALNLQQITCTGHICKIAKEGERLLMLTQDLETSRKGIFAIGGAISPSYMQIGADGIIQETKHSNLIYTAIRDACIVLNHTQQLEKVP